MSSTHDKSKQNAGRHERTLWRSLEELGGAEPLDPDPRPQAELGANSDSGLLDAASLVSRRGFLSVTTATAAAVALEGCVRRPVEEILPFTQAPEHVIPGVPLHFATVTERRGEALGLLVTSYEGRPTKAEGNPNHGTSRGKSDGWAQASVLDLYDPDRSRMPARRADGSGQLTDAGESADAAYAALDETLAARLREHASDGGAGLRILSAPSNSPTFMRLRSAVLERFPSARFHAYTSVHEGNIRAGTQGAFGAPLVAEYHYAADVILALDSDFLMTEAGAVAATGRFAQGRRLSSARDSMNRLYAVEPTHSVTGSNADHRLRLPASRVADYARALAKLILADGNVQGGLAASGLDFSSIISALGTPSTEGIPESWLGAVAKDLLSHRGRSVIVAGARQPASVHALVHALNAALGNFGQTVKLTPAPDAEFTDPVQDLMALAADMQGGRVRTLLMLGGNPVYDAPADANFSDALENVEFSLHLASHRDESSRRSVWHAPRAHELESWGDQVAMNGTYSVQQPLIAPLHGGRSDLEILATVAGEGDTRPHSQVRRTFGQRGGGERAWRRALHAGVVAASEAEHVATATVASSNVAELMRAESASGPAPSANSLEVVFAPCTKLFDGRYANSPWMLELPENMTKISWDNAALISAATARDLGVGNGQLVKFSREGAHEVELPVWILPGHADHTVSLALGWGRTHAGRYGSAQGFDVHPLRTSEGYWFAGGVRAVPTGREHFMARTQEHGSMEGRPVAIDATLDEYKENPNFPTWQSIKMKQGRLWDTVDYSKGHKWGMSIDLNQCTGCNACVVACQAENNIPSVGKRHIARGREMYWIRMDRYFVGDADDPQVNVQPIGCQQCEDAPCENVCPVNATAHTPEGLNDMSYNRCIGTRYCANNCPYKVRRFNYLSWHNHLDDKWAGYDDIPETRKMQFNPNVSVRMRGVMEKCTYCVQRIQESKIASRRDDQLMLDAHVTPACAQACPAGAIVFGDLNGHRLEVRRGSSFLGKTAQEITRSERIEEVRLLDAEGQDKAADAVVEVGDTIASKSLVAELTKHSYENEVDSPEDTRAYKLLAEIGTRPRTTFLAKIRNPNPEMAQ